MVWPSRGATRAATGRSRQGQSARSVSRPIWKLPASSTTTSKVRFNAQSEATPATAAG